MKRQLSPRMLVVAVLAFLHIGIPIAWAQTVDTSRPIAIYHRYLAQAPSMSEELPWLSEMQSLEILNKSDTATTRFPERVIVSNEIFASNPPSSVVGLRDFWLADPNNRSFASSVSFGCQSGTSCLLSPGATKETVKAAVTSRLNTGYKYVIFDEVTNLGVDGQALTQANQLIVRDALADLHADPATRGRVIISVNSYNLSGTTGYVAGNPSTGEFAPFSTILQACARYCRVIESQAYLTVAAAKTNVAAPTLETCVGGLNCLKYTADRLRIVAGSGSTGRIVTALMVSSSTHYAEDPVSFCHPGTVGGVSYPGALAKQIEKLRNPSGTAVRLPGVAFFSLANIADKLANGNVTTYPQPFTDYIQHAKGCIRVNVRDSLYANVPFTV